MSFETSRSGNPKSNPRNYEFSFPKVFFIMLSQPHDDFTFVMLTVANNKISMVLVDTKSSIDVMFHDRFIKLSLQYKDISPSPYPIIIFTEHTAYLKGLINSPTKMGIHKGKSCHGMVDHIIMDVVSAYNIIVGRPLLNSLKETLTIHKL